MSTKVAGLEIIKLWPSIFLEKDLPDHEAPTRQLIALAESRPGDGVFAIDDAGVEWLKGQVAQAIGAYLHETGHAGAPKWDGSGRFETLGFGDFRPLANQPGADLAGMYVLQWPSQRDPAGGRDDALPGCFSFYDPRIAMNMNAIKRDPYHDYHKHLIARAGLLAIWPAYLSYFVHPNPSRESAIRVTFDVQLHTRPRSA
jgi:hypothetical protein